MLEKKGSVVVAIVEGRVLSEHELVLGVVTERLKCAVFIEMVGEPQVGVGESGCSAGVFAVFGDKSEDPVGISGPCPCDD